MSLSINILYGSQNGTARNIAQNLEKDLISENIPTVLLELNDYKKAQFANNIVNFIIISTTGDGEAPDNATDFYNNLIAGNNDLCNSLKNQKYGLLGLGDSYFTYFCKPSKDIDQKLKEINSIKVVETAFGDDAKNFDEIVENWVKEVKSYIKSASNLKVETGSSSSTPVEEGKNTDIMEGIELTNDGTNFTEITSTNDTCSIDSIYIPYMDDDDSDEEETELRDENGVEIEDDINASEYTPVTLVFDKKLLSQITQLNHVVKKPISYLTLASASKLYRSVKYSKSQHIFPLIPKKLNSDHNILQYSENNPFAAKILSIHCLTNNAIKKAIQVTLDITGLNWRYEPGYAFGIVAPNSDKLVLPLLKRLGLNPEDGFRATTTKENLCSGLPILLNKCYTYYEAFKYFININALPKKSFLRMLAEYCSDKEDKKQLYFLCSSQGAPSYRHLKSQYPSLLDILHTFKSCHPPFQAILENSVRIPPRYYSISSSPLENPNTISFIFNVEKYTMPVSLVDGKIHLRYGLCSGWLDELLEYPSVPDCYVNFRTKPLYLPIFPKIVNTFVLPPQPLSKSIIMAGAGTGVAPFISFIEYKRQVLEGSDDSSDDTSFSSSSSSSSSSSENNSEPQKPSILEPTGDIGQWHLFYGCRSIKKDCLIKNYKVLWEQVIRSESLSDTKIPVLDQLVITTSREGNGPNYIQDAMVLSENSRELGPLLKNRKTYIYVCGNKAMCRDIHEALVTILQKEENMTIEEAQIFLEKLYKERRYLRDIWG